MKKKTKKLWIYFLTGTVLLISFFYFQNNSLVITKYTITSEKLPPSLDGYRIVQLSDLHNKSFGKDQSRIVEKVTESKPDLIVFTGDLIDADTDDETPSLILMERLVQFAPVYFVTGNHEWWSNQFDTLESSLNDIGVQVMRNEAEEVAVGDDHILIAGIDDPANITEREHEKAIMEERIGNLSEEINGQDQFQILLSHRPELFSLYTDHEFDVVFSGHAHGGQFRIPFVGGLIAPDQGFPPRYTSGTYTSNNTTMVVNRGLGNSVIPVRFLNRPEVVLVTLESVN